MVRFDICPARTALLIIDMINAFLKPGSPLEIAKGRELVPRLNKLILACREKGISIIFIKHAHRENRSDMGLYTEFVPAMTDKPLLIEGTADVEIDGEIDRQKGDIVIVKRAFSAFYGTDIDHVLRIKGIDTLIIGGIATDSCCEATARDARHRNYKVIFLSDGTATYDNLPDMGWGAISGDEVQRVVLTILAYRNADVSSVEDVLGRLSRPQG